MLFKDIQDLSQLDGNIEKIVERRVQRTITNEFIAWAKWYEISELVKRFSPEPMAFNTGMRAHNTVLMNFQKMAGKKPDTPYLDHIFKALMERSENGKE